MFMEDKNNGKSTFLTTELEAGFKVLCLYNNSSQ